MIEIAKDFDTIDFMAPSVLRKSPLRIFFLQWTRILAGLSVCFLSHAQDSSVSESPKNSFKPDRVWRVSIAADSRQTQDTPPVIWNQTASKVVTRSFGSSVDSTAYLDGEFKKPNAKDWRILWQDREFEVKPSGAFRLEIPYDSDLSSLELMAVANTGEVEFHFYRLAVTTLQPVSSEKSVTSAANRIFKKKIDKRFYISPGLGVTLIQYTQTDFAPYSATVLTAKVSANYLLLPPKWDLGATAFATAFTLSHTGDVSVRFIGLNLRLGYLFPAVKDPWRFAVYGGWYYSTMLASDQTFGYLNISGPQLFPTLRRTFANGHAMTGYLKFSPVSNALSLMSLSNNEIAVGLGYLIPTKKHTYSVNLDYARLSFTAGATALTSSNLTLGGSMSF